METKKMTRSHEKVRFTLIQVPCCKHLLCWVNPRMPNFCPECGTAIWLKKVGSHIVQQDDEAWISVRHE